MAHQLCIDLWGLCLLIIIGLSFGQKHVPSMDINLMGKPGEGYYIGVHIGTPPQKFNVLVDTGSTNFAIAAAPNQNIDYFYKVANSSTYKSRHRQVSVLYTQGHWSGELGNDVLNFPSLKVHQVRCDIALIQTSHNFYMNGSQWQHLEHYLEKIAVDHAEMPMNFAEAALLIQNSTTIYSKKVDYIWDIMQCVLANIHKKKHDSKSSEKQTESENSQEESSSKSKRSRNHNSLDRTKYGEINTEISDKILDLEATKEKRKPWRFIPTIYHQFQKKSISRKTKYTYAEPDDPHEDRKFKVNQWLLHYKMLHHEFKDEDGIPDVANCFQNSISMLVDHNATFHVDQMDDHMDDSVSHGGGDEPLENAELPIVEELAETCNAEAAVRREKDNLLTVALPPAAPLPPINAWDPIPFDQGMTDKEIGHRKTIRLPCDIDLLEPPPENGKRKKGKEILPKSKQILLSKYLQQKSLLRKDVKKQFVLDQDFLLQRDLMAQQNQLPKKPIKFAEIRHELASDFDQFADFLGFEDYENCVGDNGTGFLGFGDNRDLDNTSPDHDNDDMFNDIVEPLDINVPLPANDHLGLELPPDSEMMRTRSKTLP